MIGSKSFSIGAKELSRGVSTASNLADGGFSPETDAVNLIAEPGVLHAVALPTDKSSGLSGNFIASTQDFNTVAPNNRYFVDDTGHFYSWNGSALANPQTDGSGTYTDGKTDMIACQLGFLTTTASDIVFWDGTGTAGAAHFDATWWTVTKGQAALNSHVPHPMVLFQGYVWLGDGNKLHKIDPATGTVTASFLVLLSGDTITAFSVEPGSGYMLISCGSGENLSDTLARTSKVHYYDGFSNKPVKNVLTEDVITSFIVNEGTTFAFYGQNFGQFTGSGLRFLRKLSVSLSNVPSNANGGLIWHNRRTAIGTTVYYADGPTIMAYGPIEQGGRRIFYPAYKNHVNGNAHSLVTNIGSNKLGLGFAPTSFYTFDVTSIATNNTMAFYTNKYLFERPIWIRQIWIARNAALAANNDPGSLTIYDETGTATLIDLQNKSGGTEYLHKITGINIKVNTLQYLLNDSNFITGIREIITRFDPAEI